MQTARENGLFVAIISSVSGVQHDYGRIRLRANKRGFHEYEAYVVSLDRVAIEILLREYMPTPVVRERIVPALLTQRVILSWWSPNGSEPEARESSNQLRADPELLYVALVPLFAKVCVMEALSGWKL